MNNIPDSNDRTSQSQDNGCTGDGIWQTKDMDLIVILLARGHKPVDDGVYKKDDVLWFCFRIDEVAQDIVRFNSDIDFKISVREYLDAKALFKSYMRRFEIKGKRA
jgi:hypothetical protein